MLWSSCHDGTPLNQVPTTADTYTPKMPPEDIGDTK